MNIINSMDDILKASVLYELAANAAINYQGDTFELKQAFGSLVFAYIYGWRSLYAYSGQSVAENHGKLLNLDFTMVCPEITDIPFCEVPPFTNDQ